MLGNPSPFLDCELTPLNLNLLSLQKENNSFYHLILLYLARWMRAEFALCLAAERAAISARFYFVVSSKVQLTLVLEL